MRSLFLLIALLSVSVPSARAEFGMHAGTHFGFGELGDSSSGLLGRKSVGTFDIQAMPGWKFAKSFLAGMMFDIRFISQMEPAAAGTSLGGTGFLTGPGFAVNFAPYKILFAWDWRARSSAPDAKVSLKGSGYHILASYMIAGSLSGDLEYVRARYNGVEINEVGSDISENPVIHYNIGFGVSYIF